MTVTVASNKVQYSPVSPTTSFAFDFRVDSAAELVVIHTDSGGIETILVGGGTDYTIVGTLPLLTGGSITTIASYTTGDRLTLKAIVPLTQQTDYVANDKFPAETHEAALDKTVRMVQQISEEISRAFRLAEGDVGLGTLPAAELRALKFLAFDSTGLPIASAGGIDPATPVSVFMESVIAAANAGAAQALLGLRPLTIPGSDQSLNTLGEVGFTGLPSWIERITVLIQQASVDGTDIPLVQLGDLGSGYKTSGYTGAASSQDGLVVNLSAGFQIARVSAAPEAANTIMMLQRIDQSTTWVAGWISGYGTSLSVHSGAGVVNLSGPVDRIRLKASGSNLFDGGTVNISYE